MKRVVIVALLACSTARAQSVGELVHDGPPTPEQLSLFVPVTGTIPSDARATVRYRDVASASWSTAHPLHRIRSDFAAGPAANAFAGIIAGLEDGATYVVEASFSGTGLDMQRSLVTTTRSLPPPSPAATISVDTTSELIAALASLGPGDVLELASGVYDVDQLVLDRSGTEEQPIVIRGASRDGVVIRDNDDRVLYLLDASHVVIEDLTLVGSESDSDVASSSEGIRFWDGQAQRDVVIRRVTMLGVDKAVVGEHQLEQIVVYDCTLTGNNVWTQDFLETNRSWNDDGVRLPGQGNVAFNNTLSGFGDSFAMADGVDNVGVHFYRNDIVMTCDDAYEGDYGVRNVSFYDNRVHNAMTLTSFDPIYGGPAYVFRNVAVNLGRQPFKLNNTNTGFFIYNNTVVRTNGYGSGAGWGWVQFNNGALRAWAYRNNLLVWRGDGGLLAIESGGNTPIDFDHNGWFPDGSVWWSNSGGSFATMSAARANVPVTTPLFGTSTKRHDGDVIVEADPFQQPVSLATTYLTRVTTLASPQVAPGSTARNAGVAIPGVTDGFDGAAPDLGALVAGRAAIRWGDRDAEPDRIAPGQVGALTVR